MIVHRRAEKEYQLAIELDPNSAEVHNDYAHHLGKMGRFDEAIPVMKRAQQLNPSVLGNRVSGAQLFLEARRYEECIEQLEITLELNSLFPPPRRNLAQVYEAQGRYEEAVAAYQKFLPLIVASEEEGAGLADAYQTAGKEGYWRWMLDFWRERSKQEYVSSQNIARFYAQLGEKDRAFEWIEKAFEENEDLSRLKVFQAWDPLRDDPRFMTCCGG